MADKSYKVKFKPPSTYTAPDDKQPGETFDATVQIRIEEDGRFCILSLDGVPMNEGEEETPDTEEKASPPANMMDAARATRAMGGYGM